MITALRFVGEGLEGMRIDAEVRSASRHKESALDEQHVVIALNPRKSLSYERAWKARSHRALALRSAGDVEGHEFHGNQWTAGGAIGVASYSVATTVPRVQREKIGKALGYVVKNHGEYASKIHVIVAPTGKGATNNPYGYTKRNISVENGKPVRDAAGNLVHSGKYTVYVSSKQRSTEDFVRTISHEFEHVAQWERGETPHEVGAMHIGGNVVRKFKGLARHPESAIHAAADAHYKPMFLTVMAAFMRGKKALRGSLRGAEEVGHEFHGNQWTAGNGGEAHVWRGVRHEGDARIARPEYGFTTYSSSKEVATSYVKAGDAKPFTLGSKKLVEFPVAKAKYGSGNEFDKFEFDKRAAALGPHEVLVARNVYDNGPHASTDKDPERKFSYPSDIYAVKNPALVKEGHVKTRHAAVVLDITSAISAIRSSLLKDLPPVLLKTMVAGGEVGMGMLHKQSRVLGSDGRFRVAADTLQMKFDVNSPEAIKWAREHTSKIADDISQTSKDRINEAVAKALEGDGLDAAYDDILDAVGDEARADMIARTEIMSAANAGLSESWSQAQDAGLLPPDATKQWIATSDACPECEEADGEEVPLGDDFSVGDDPPLHPNCRCTMGIGTGEA